ncbi:MAG: site-specific integrase [Chloroflexota bacterium]
MLAGDATGSALDAARTCWGAPAPAMTRRAPREPRPEGPVTGAPTSCPGAGSPASATRTRGPPARATALGGRRPIALGGAPDSLDAALEAYLDQLRVERGLSAATIRAYDTDLRAFARRAGHRGLGPQRRPGRPLGREPRRPPSRLRPASVRRKAAAVARSIASAPGRG